MQRGVTILDVFRDEALYLEFGREQLSPEKIESSVNVFFENPDQLKKIIDDYLIAKIREIFSEDADEEIKAFMASPEYKLMMLKFKLDFPKAKQAYLDFYMERFFGHKRSSIVEE